MPMIGAGGIFFFLSGYNKRQVMENNEYRKKAGTILNDSELNYCRVARAGTHQKMVVIGGAER